ncbi:major facilitator superfamily domain-containing protein [Dichotomocladium elegans]|nr:major facilitator superfamily domain-containing protein [Dichotomocladium elegans]
MKSSRWEGVQPYVLFCALVASIGTFNSGVNTSSMNIPASFVRTCESDPDALLPLCIPMSDWEWYVPSIRVEEVCFGWTLIRKGGRRGAATGMYPVGGLLGALIAGPFAKRLGRRDSMIYLNLAFVIGAALISTATTSTQFAIGRIFTGIGSGFMTVVVAMYISEIAPAAHRGALVGILQLMTTAGILFIELVGLGLRSSVGWRVSAVITVAPSAIQSALLPLCARSPRWLLSHDRVDEARTQLVRLRKGDIESEFADMSVSLELGTAKELPAGTDGDSRSEVDSTLAQTSTLTAKKEQPAGDCVQENKTVQQQQKQLSLVQVLRIPVLATLLFKMLIFHAGSQLSGINAIMYYSTSIFEQTFGGASAAYVTIGTAAINVAATVVGLILVDKLGRKVLVIVSCGIMCCASAIMTVGLRLDVGVLQVVCILVFVTGFGVGLGIVPFLYTPECFPTCAVDPACSVALVVNWLFNFVIGFIFPTLMNVCGDYVFLIFGSVAFLLTVFVAFALIETKRKSIDEIGRELGWYGLNTNMALPHIS